MKIALNFANQCLDHSLGGRGEGAWGGGDSKYIVYENPFNVNN